MEPDQRLQRPIGGGIERKKHVERPRVVHWQAFDMAAVGQDLLGQHLTLRPIMPATVAVMQQR